MVPFPATAGDMAPCQPLSVVIVGNKLTPIFHFEGAEICLSYVSLEIITTIMFLLMEELSQLLGISAVTCCNIRDQNVASAKKNTETNRNQESAECGFIVTVHLVCE